MIETKIIDGRQTSQHFLHHLQNEFETFEASYGIKPSLAIVRVGQNPESAVYVNHKMSTFKKFGFPIQEHWFDENVSSSELETFLKRLNEDPHTSGIIIQLPLPPHLSRTILYEKVSPLKDVDGLTTLNAGNILHANPYGLYPCTPLACFFLLSKLYGSLSQKRVLVVGRSLLVGKPLSLLCLDAHATITIAHSHSPELTTLLKEADIVIAAAGSAHLIDGSHINLGTCVLDVGISVKPGSSGKERRILGDTHTNSLLGVASYCTPVPGGIGPMTISFLAFNTLKAAYLQKSVFKSYDFQNYPGLSFSEP